MRVFYRLVFFTPDPVFETTRFAVAALVDAHDVTCAVFAKRLPCAVCAGGGPSHRLLWDFVDLLPQRVTTIARLPEFAGPSFSLDRERVVPGQQEDPVAWVRNFVLPGGTTP